MQAIHITENRCNWRYSIQRGRASIQKSPGFRANQSLRYILTM